MSNDVEIHKVHETEEEAEQRLRKAQEEGYLFFQRCGEPEWEDINSFYAYATHENPYAKQNTITLDYLEMEDE